MGPDGPLETLPRRATCSGIEWRDQTDDPVTVDAANAIRQYCGADRAGPGVKGHAGLPGEAG
jgi:hypothetical protein